jgi:cadmium resistance protein CadD (predicted permease)
MLFEQEHKISEQLRFTSAFCSLLVILGISALKTKISHRPGFWEVCIIFDRILFQMVCLLIGIFCLVNINIQ